MPLYLSWFTTSKESVEAVTVLVQRLSDPAGLHVVSRRSLKNYITQKAHSC
jgi:hypothetical protein